MPSNERRARRREPESFESREIVAVVTDLRETVPYQYVITLDNGQVWRQSRPHSAYRLRAGVQVRIYSTPKFGYRLAMADYPGFTAVERAR
jgi:hypothetical protein